MNENTNDEIFRTGDVFLASFIEAQTHQIPTYITVDNTVYFCFPSNEQTVKAIFGFNNGANTNAFMFVQLIKKNRSRIGSRIGKQRRRAKEAEIRAASSCKGVSNE
jgi:hypothetical protein